MTKSSKKSTKSTKQTSSKKKSVKKKSTSSVSPVSREERKKALQQRTADNVENREKGNFRGARVLNLSVLGDREVKFWKPKKGMNLIDILPYIVKTKNHPDGMKPGYEDYILALYVHKGVGPANGSYVCLKRTYGKACPICEEYDDLKNQGAPDKKLGPLVPSKRAFYNMKDLNSDEDPDEIMLWEASYAYFEKELLDEAETTDDGEIITFSDIEDGCSISFKAVTAKFMGNSYFKYKKFDFEERDEPYDESIFEETISLDELLVIPTYEEVRDAFLGVDDDDDDDEDDDFDEEVDEEIEEDDDDEEPVRKTRSRKTRSRVEEEDDDDEDDEKEEAEEEPVKKKSKKKRSKAKCPHGHTFGEDCEDYDECEDCDMWEACADAGE